MCGCNYTETLIGKIVTSLRENPVVDIDECLYHEHENLKEFSTCKKITMEHYNAVLDSFAEYRAALFLKRKNVGTTLCARVYLEEPHKDIIYKRLNSFFEDPTQQSTKLSLTVLENNPNTPEERAAMLKTEKVKNYLRIVVAYFKEYHSEYEKYVKCDFFKNRYSDKMCYFTFLLTKS